MSATELLGRWGTADRVLALYGLGVPESPAFLYGVHLDPLDSFSVFDAHTSCWIGQFCRNPLHPGPCKGWKGTLAKVAPGALKLIEEERKKKLAAKQAAKAAAVKKAAKAVDQAKRGAEVDAHPAAKKKMAAKAVAKILAGDEAKAEGVKLNQKEMAWHAQKKASQLVAANMAAGNLKTKAAQQKYRAYARKEILAALKADAESGATGPDSEYQKTLGKLANAMAVGHTNKHYQDAPDDENGDEVHAAVAEAFEAAIKKDLADQKTQGDDPGNVKALTKKLDDLPGEVGSEEHNQAVADTMGVTLKKQKPFSEPAKPEPVAGGMTPAQAKKFATAWGKIAQVIGVPKDKWPALKAKAEAAALAGGDPMADPMIQKSMQNAVDALVANASWHAYGWAPEAKEMLAKAYAEEIAAQLKKGGTKLEEGSLLDLANKLKTGKISSYWHQQEVEKKLKLPMKGATPGPADGSTGIPKNKIDDALDDAFSPPAPQSMDDVDAKIAAQNAANEAKLKAKKSVNALAPDATGGGSSVNAVGKNDGGAGAGGPAGAKKAGNAYGDLHEEILGDGEGTDTGQQVEDDLNDTSNYEADLDFNAQVLTNQLLDDLSGGGSDLTPDEQAALKVYVKPLIKQAMISGDASSAKASIQTLKKLGTPQLQAMAKAMKQNLDDGALPGDDGDPIASAPLVTTPGHVAQSEKITAGIVQAAMQMDPDNIGPAIKGLTDEKITAKMAKSIEDGSSDANNEVKKLAKAVATVMVKNKNKQNGGTMASTEEFVLAHKLAEAIAEQVATGQPHPLVQEVADNEPGKLKAKAAALLAAKPATNNIGDAKASMDAISDPDLDAKLTAGFTGPPTNSAGDPVTKVSPDLAKQAGMNAKVWAGPIASLELALENGDKFAAEKAADEVAAAMALSLGSKLLKDYGFVDSDQQALVTDIMKKLQADYKEALLAGADEPGGLAGVLDVITSNINNDVDQVAKDNGWTNPSPSTKKSLDALKGSKLLIMTGALSGTMDTDHTASPKKKGKPAGAGGGSTAPNIPITTGPVDTTPAPAKKAAAKKAAPKKATKVTQAAVKAGKGKKPTAKDHGVLVEVAGQPNPNSHGAPVSKPIKQNGQTILPPEGIYPISQVIVDGRENEVADFNAAVNSGLQGKEAANEPRNFTELTGAQSSSVYSYSSSGYGPINGFLRPPSPGVPSENPDTNGNYLSTADKVAHMDAAFNDSRISQPITTLRGFTGGPESLGVLWTQRRNESWAGAEVRDLAYSSSSVNMGTARSFAGAGGPNAVIMRIHMPAGTRAINLVGQGAHGGEAEILLNRGARLRIVADNGYQNGARHLDVEVICESDDCAE